MDSAKVCRFLAASFLLLLTLLGDPAAACSHEKHPQNVYCSSTIVIKAKFVGVTEHEYYKDYPVLMKRYEIITTKVFKAPEGMQDIRFIYSYPLCRYDHFSPLDGKEEYVITGLLDSDHVGISLCDFIQPWAELTAAQKRGAKLCRYDNCIVLSNNDCPWMGREGSQTQDMACLPIKGNSSACSWKTLKS